jgi:hypothetical protein
VSDLAARRLSLPGLRVRRKRPLPPNWKLLLFAIAWDVLFVLIAVFNLALERAPWAAFFGASCALDIAGLVRVWRAGGNYRAHPWTAEVWGLWATALAVIVIGWLV